MTTDHDEIRRWAEERDARPSCVRGTGGEGDIGMLRLDLPGYSGEGKLEEISWDDWFDKFEERGLALLYQDTTARGEKSNFNKIIARETAKARAQGQRKANRRTAAVGKRAATARTRKTRAGARSTRATGTRGRSAKSARGRAGATASTRGAATRGRARSTSTKRVAAQKKTSARASQKSRTRRKAA